MAVPWATLIQLDAFTECFPVKLLTDSHASSFWCWIEKTGRAAWTWLENDYIYGLVLATVWILFLLLNKHRLSFILHDGSWSIRKPRHFYALPFLLKILLPFCPLCDISAKEKQTRKKSAAQSNEEFHFVDAGQEFVISLICRLFWFFTKKKRNCNRCWCPLVNEQRP